MRTTGDVAVGGEDRSPGRPFGADSVRLWSVGAACVPVAWLLPNHHHPWLSAWLEGTALALFCLALLVLPRQGQIAGRWVAFLLLCVGTVLAQVITGRLLFMGDAWMVISYLVVFGAAIVLGGEAARSTDGGSVPPVEQLAAGVVLAAIMSVGAAAGQWLGSLDIGIWLVSMPPRGRPFANVAQPNHFCTIAFLGITALGLLWHRRRVSTLTFWIGGMWCTAGMVLSGSRTGWLQMGLLAACAGLAARRWNVAPARPHMLGLVLVYAMMLLLSPHVLDTGAQALRSTAEVAASGTRPLHWATMVHALMQEPCWGFGWLQAAAAQWQAIDRVGHVAEQIDYAHNLLLDLLIWNGIPAGLLLILVLAVWVMGSLRQCREGTVGWTLLGVLGFGMHALVEYPHAYAYFLIPVGMQIGIVDSLLWGHRAWLLPRHFLRVGAAVLTLALAWVGWEYAQVEPAHVQLRLQSVGIATRGEQVLQHELHVLTQLRAYLQYIGTPARRGMSDGELDAMRRVVLRYPYPPAMLRYALAAGLNGRQEVAADTLRRICLIHPPRRCDEARTSWASAAGVYPELNVAFPSDVGHVTESGP